MKLNKDFKRILIPHTSKCVIHTTGTVHDGDVIDITSPIFNSIDFSSGDTNIQSHFNVPVKTNGKDILIDDTNFMGTLVCDDDDVFSMYVVIE